MPNHDERPEDEDGAVRRAEANDAADDGVPRTTTTGDPSVDVRSDDEKGTTADRWLEGGDQLEGHREDLGRLYEDVPERSAPERDD
jgi:hypothetical protein